MAVAGEGLPQLVKVYKRDLHACLSSSTSSVSMNSGITAKPASRTSRMTAASEAVLGASLRGTGAFDFTAMRLPYSLRNQGSLWSASLP